MKPEFIDHERDFLYMVSTFKTGLLLKVARTLPKKKIFLPSKYKIYYHGYINYNFLEIIYSFQT